MHKILVVIEPLLIDEDYYAREEGLLLTLPPLLLPLPPLLLPLPPLLLTLPP